MYTATVNSNIPLNVYVVAEKKLKAQIKFLRYINETWDVVNDEAELIISNISDLGEGSLEDAQELADLQNVEAI